MQNITSKYKKILSVINSNNKYSLENRPVSTIAVTKNQKLHIIREALDSGIRIFGENRVQEAEQKFLGLKEAFNDLELHMIGPMQTNKVKKAIGLFDYFHTLDREKLAKEFFKCLQMEKSNKFCIKPFTSVVIDTAGNLKPCCSLNKKLTRFKNKKVANASNGINKYYNSKYNQYLRKKFLNNEAPEECQLCWDQEAREFESERIRANYLHTIEKLNGIPFPLFHSMNNVDDILNIIDGIIITGGNFDIEPSLYGHLNQNSRNKKSLRTNFEIELFNKSFLKKIPILGICGGEQVINVALGGTLIQDIKSLKKKNIRA